MLDASRLAVKRFHYVCVVAAVPFLVLLVTAGIRATPGVRMVPLEGEFGWSYASISAAVAITWCGSRSGGRWRHPNVHGHYQNAFLIWVNYRPDLDRLRLTDASGTVLHDHASHTSGAGKRPELSVDYCATSRSTRCSPRRCNGIASWSRRRCRASRCFCVSRAE